ncbi:related to Alpha-mannosidase [Saccharomycodes ludwigii]|uniref:Alpha-mannosidase n=1 Tax=Saccharomycodes ludwigii TaxID=36035 RepID=A0A376B6Z0_9ASCO|nr:related to Alpha-mannosidase [Saccharomycodes ludwigii]
MSATFRNQDPQFKPVDHIYEDRLRQFISKNNDINKYSYLSDYYDLKRYSSLNDTNDEKYISIQYYQVPFNEDDPTDPNNRPSWKSIINAGNANDFSNKNFKSCFKNQPFGPSWSTTWFRVEINIPFTHDDEQWTFQFDCENEGLLIDPITFQPITSFSGKGERIEYLLPKRSELNKNKLVFFIECGNNGMFGCGFNGDINPPDNNKWFHLLKADLVLPNWDARSLFYDFWICSDLAREGSQNSWQKHKARMICNQVMDIFNREEDSIDHGINKCRDLLKKELLGFDIDSSKVYFNHYSSGSNDNSDTDSSITPVFALGNCHIDTAWLWPFAETKRKVVRSWSSQVTLMDRYPEYRFVASQGQQFKWLKVEHPDFFNKKLVPKIKNGQFIPIGGTWVENDTNMPCGESLCRQFFYGQRFSIRNFDGLISKCFWLPDTFGYSSNIPQIARLSQIQFFLTQKLSWNNINTFPHSTFQWRGIDGSQLLTHMPPANTYTCDAHFGDVVRTHSQNKSLYCYPSGLMLYGKGDGGGGPTDEMLEKMRRIRGLNNKLGDAAVPKLSCEQLNVNDFFNDILRKTNNGCDLPTWSGELYLEFHRGTYTTQAYLKKLMRYSEHALLELEKFATWHSLNCYTAAAADDDCTKKCNQSETFLSGNADNYEYPVKEIGSMWEDVLLCQFHDVLPGSCIEMVYKHEAIPKLEAVLDKCDKLCNDIILDIKSKDDYVVIDKNSNAFRLCEESYASHYDYRNSFIFGTKMYGHQQVEKQVVNKVGFKKDNPDIIVLSNNHITVEINKVTGLIVDVSDDKYHYLDLSHGRNKSGANQFVLFDDKPLNWQAWDTELYDVNNYKVVDNLESVDINEAEAKVTIKFKICGGQSGAKDKECFITTKVSLDKKMIVFNTIVENWYECNKFLKVEFPVNVNNDYCSYETQFGITKRPTHYNTSWDTAKFEVCHHKFADYSEYSKGVSIINDSKYGFATHGNLMRLSLLRSPKAPDAHADMGYHQIKYAMLPHKGQLGMETVNEAIKFNKYHINNMQHIPLENLKTYNEFFKIKPVHPRVDTKGFKNGESSEDLNVVISSIKRGEDDFSKDKSEYSLKEQDCDEDSPLKSVVVRVYEPLGGEVDAYIEPYYKIEAVERVDNLEIALDSKVCVDHGENRIKIKLKPFEIASFKFYFKTIKLRKS